MLVIRSFSIVSLSSGPELPVRLVMAISTGSEMGAVIGALGDGGEEDDDEEDDSSEAGCTMEEER